MTRRTLSSVLLAAALVATLVAKDLVTIDAVFDTGSVSADGRIGEWKTLSSITKEVAMAVANDGDRLTVAVASSDPKTRQRLMVGGLILYVDRTGKKSETFGVRVPPIVGAMGRGADGPRSPGQTPTYVEVIGPAKDQRHIVDLSGSAAFHVASGDNEGTLLIELSLPLRSTSSAPYAPEIPLNHSSIAVGLATPQPPQGGRGGDGNRGGGPGGSGGGARGARGGGGPGGGGPGGGMPDRGMGGGDAGKEINTWVTVNLAAKP